MSLTAARQYSPGGSWRNVKTPSGEGRSLRMRRDCGLQSDGFAGKRMTVWSVRTSPPAARSVPERRAMRSVNVMIAPMTF
ncbi:MAG: hypothetical protein DMF86_02070 [Acidobacteria bacterium]|nr:MAG: hypothetical protein DMF86_02070 [Acidobacteriota bacterium]